MRNPHRVIFSASPDYGLYTLLDLWSRVREKVSDAELFVFSDFRSWEKSNPDEPTKYLIEQLKERMRSTPGVHSAIRERSDFAKILQISGVWTYASSREPESSVYEDMMLAMRAGCRVVASTTGNFIELVKGRGILVPGDALHPLTRTGYLNAFLYTLQEPEETTGRAINRSEIMKWANEQAQNAD